MDNFGAKVQKGLSNVQKGIEEGKNKIQTSQELLGLKEEVAQVEEKRSSFIFDLGELTYKKIRDGEIEGEDLNSIGIEVSSLDKEIFNLLKIIEEKTRKQENLVCECGAGLTVNDKFCKECGSKVEALISSDDKDMIICQHCESKNITSNNYCNCCGIKIK